MNSKYVKYAIGEVVLVVIGILIALTINDLNQSLKNRKVRSRMITDLETEFKANFEQMETVKNYQEGALHATYQLIDQLNKPGSSLNDSIPIWIGQLGSNWTYDAQNGSLNNAISSGEIHLLKNDSLKNLLFGWKGLTQDLDEEQQISFDYFERVNIYLEEHIQIADAIYFYTDEFPSSKFESDFEGIFLDPQFEDLLINRGIFLLDHLVELKSLQKRNIQIIQILETEL